MWKRLIKILVPISLTAVCVFLWVDSWFVVRRLPLIPFGDAALGFKSEGGWLSWNEFWLWSRVNPEAAAFSVRYWALVSLGLAFSWRAIAHHADRRFRWMGWMAISLITVSLALLQGRTDPVVDLLRAIRSPRDPYALHEAYEAAEAVNRAGRGNAAAVPLTALLEENTKEIRVTTIQALGKLHADPNAVVPALIRAFADKDLRYFVTVTLGELGPIDGRIVPALILALRDEDPRIRSAAVSALLEVGPAAEAAVPALIEALDDKPLRLEVLFALKKMGPTARPAVPALITLLKTATGYDRLNAAEALWQIDQDVDVVVPALLESLKHPFLPIRRDAANALGAIGPRASDAVPALIAARDYKPKPRPERPALNNNNEADLPIVTEMPEEDFYPVVRQAAIQALSKIEGGGSN
jgi:HEAT repeat protein